jgi:hypothetical protein
MSSRFRMSWLYCLILPLQLINNESKNRPTGLFS